MEVGVIIHLEIGANGEHFTRKVGMPSDADSRFAGDVIPAGDFSADSAVFKIDDARTRNARRLGEMMFAVQSET
jgi:hypothetical protein